MTDRGPPPHDYRQEATARVIAMVEAGTAPWLQPWNADTCPRLQFNPTTGKIYRGGNQPTLMLTAIERDYDDPRWCSYKQAADKGWQVRKGEKGTRIEFWEVKPGRAG